MNYITLDNIDNFINKTVDCNRRLFHYYPLTIGKKFKRQILL